MITIHLLYEQDKAGNPHGCGHIRLLRPFSHPSLANQARITQGLDLGEESPDVVVVERGWLPYITVEDAQTLVRKVRDRGICLIYTLDDNLLDLNEEAPWEAFPSHEQRLAIRHLSREADGIIVSTPNLQQRFSRLNQCVLTVPNALDERLFQRSSSAKPNPSRRPIRIGYMGTRTHTSDLLMILAPLRAFLRKHEKDVILELVGVYSDTRLEQCFAGYPVRFVDVGDSVDYLKFIPWAQKNMGWDFAIAPLEDSEFNSCKSDIKFLDYAMLGIPGIFSAVSSYETTVEHKKTGWLCGNSSEEWSEALETLYSDASLRQSLKEAATAYVTEHRTLEHCAVQWLSAVTSIVASS